MKSVVHNYRDWRMAGQRARAWQLTGGHPVVVQSDQLGGQTADRYSSLGDCGSVHEP